jgi:hypothetical protein
MSAISAQAGLHELLHLPLSALAFILKTAVDAMGRFEVLACHL